jgi:uncharacterized protein
MRWKELAALAAIIIVAAAPATAQVERPAASQPPATVLNINAEGISEARPDMAVITIGVQTEGRTAQAALNANQERMNALVASLRANGIAERDLQTAYVNVQPQYDGTSQRRIVNYQARNTVRAKVRNVDNVGRVMDSGVEDGANTIHGVSFAHQHPQQQLDVARRNAAASARERAELYASALGLRVVRVISVTEAGAAAPSYSEEIVVTGSRVRGDYNSPHRLRRARSLRA